MLAVCGLDLVVTLLADFLPAAVVFRDFVVLRLFRKDELVPVRHCCLVLLLRQGLLLLPVKVVVAFIHVGAVILLQSVIFGFSNFSS